MPRRLPRHAVPALRPVAFTAAAALALAACGGSGEETAATPSPTSEAGETAPEPSTLADNETQEADETQAADETQEAIVDDSVPSVFSGEYETLSGQSLDLGSLEGKDVVLWFWAPW